MDKPVQFVFDQFPNFFFYLDSWFWALNIQAFWPIVISDKQFVDRNNVY
jgi:hypothetical protein